MKPAPKPEYGIAPPSYRLPDGTHVGRVRLQISDLEQSLAYYESVLGLRVVERDAGTATLAAHGNDTALIELLELKGATPVPRRGRLGLYHFAILLPTRAALGRFLAHLDAIGVHAGMSDHLVSEAIYLSDPDGLGIEVYADRPRDSWTHADKQLRMATEPLDVASVIAAAGGEPWTGMPSGTVMGHVHLFVDDLARAATFYHEGVGFDKVVWGYPGALFMSAGGYHHHLGTNTWAAGAAPASANDARLLEWMIVVPSEHDAAAVASSVQKAGFSATPDDTTWTVTDPWGTTLRITT